MNEWTFTVTQTLSGNDRQEAWDAWIEWLREPLNVEAYTVSRSHEYDEVEAETPTTVATCPRNHDPLALYATKMAAPQGVARYGEHFGCTLCDEEGNDGPTGFVKPVHPPRAENQRPT